MHGVWVHRDAFYLYSELKTCIVELNFPLSQWPIQTPNNVHYVQSACLCPVQGFHTIFHVQSNYLTKWPRWAQFCCASSWPPAFSKHLVSSERGQTVMTRCSRIISADENTVLSWPIANVSFLWRTGRGERGSKNWVPAPHGVVMIKLIVWGSLKRWVQSNAWWQCGTSLAAMFVHHCGVTIVERGNPERWRKTSLPWRPKQCLLLPSSLLQNRWGCQPMADLCLGLFYSCRGTSWPMFNMRGSPRRLCMLCVEFRAAAAEVPKCAPQQRYPLWPWAAQGFSPVAWKQLLPPLQNTTWVFGSRDSSD